jgi:hypothetical protein
VFFPAFDESASKRYRGRKGGQEQDTWGSGRAACTNQGMRSRGTAAYSLAEAEIGTDVHVSGGAYVFWSGCFGNGGGRCWS